ncbi:hypothetical protein MKY96_33775 [Paenibacillus sp. FSL R7-0302]
MTNDEYFFYEWLILQKGMSLEDFERLSDKEVNELQAEWKREYDKLI